MAALAATIANDAGIENDELGAPVSVCDGPAGEWSQAWPGLTFLG